MSWKSEFKVILERKIDEAINSANNNDIDFPFWFGDNIYSILADSVLNVLKGMEDMQEYMKREGHTE